MTTQIFVNMQVNDLAKSKAFFEALDYSFNAQFTNDDAAALVISDTIYAMLHTPTSMTRFLPKGKSAAVPTKQTEVLLALSFESKDAVDTIYDKAIAAGATECRLSLIHISEPTRPY